jgi:flavin reductase (DIM6/NTAB) family NADH-FMN oxidoreductase RutF
MSYGSFTKLSRQQFRKYFQPSRLLLCVLPAPTPSGINVFTVSFNMYCSYKPPMMAIAVHNINRSWELIREADEYVLSVPGESLANETLQCGIVSLKDQDKVKTLKLNLHPSERVRVPGLQRAIANIELKKFASIETGDHSLVVGTVLKFGVNTRCRERPLISVGPDTSGYKVLAQKGIHRVAVVDRPMDRP